MAVYGGYETVRELKRTGLGSIWLARSTRGVAAPGSAVGAGETYVIKVRTSVAELIGTDRSERAIAQFLEAAQVQRAAPAAPDGRRGLSPVLASGRQGSDAYIVSEYCPRSLGSLAGRVRVDGVVMRKVAQAVAISLRQLLATGRVHANLRPGNVLFTGAGELAEAEVRIDDPAPVAGGSAQDVQNDLGDLARLLVLLATGKAYEELRGWPIQTSPEWQRLGEDETVWRRLCHDILNPNAESRPTLEQVEARIAEGEAGVQANLEAMRAAGGMAGVGFEVAPEAPRKSRRPWYIGGAAAASIAGYVIYTTVMAPEVDTGPRQGIVVKSDDEGPKIAPELLPAEGDDPRLAWTADAELTRLKPDLETLGAPSAAEKAPELTPLREQIVADVGTLLREHAEILSEMAALKEIKWIVRDADEVRRQKDAIDQRLASVDQRLGDVRARTKEFEDALRLEVRKTESLDGFQEYVVSRKASGAGLPESVRPYFGEVCDEFVAMTGEPAQLSELFRQVTKGLQSLADEIAVQRPKGTRPLDKALASKLDLIARDALHELRPLRGGAWLGEDAAFKDAWNARLGAFAGASKELIAVAEQSGKLLKTLDEGWMLGEPTGDGAPSIGAVWEAIEHTPAAAEFTTGELKPHGGDVLAVQTRVDAMRQLASTTEADDLAGRIVADDASVGEARTAWQRLGQVAAPAEALGVRRDIDLSRRLITMIQSGAIAMKREQWEETVVSDLRERWGGAMKRVATREPVAAVLALREEAGVTEEFVAGLPAYARYNIALSGLETARATLVKKPQSKQLRNATRKFAEQTRVLAAELGNRAEVAGVLEGINTALTQKSNFTQEDLQALGPGLYGWSVVTAGEDAEHAVFTQPAGRNAQVLEFRQVKNDEQNWAAYIQTTELSVAQFNAMVQGDKWAEIKTLLPERPLRLGGGPATWTARRGPRGGVSAAGAFLAANPQMQPAAPYPKGIAPGPPTGESPMQQMTPDFALIAARVVGCRFPTVEEWELALAAEGGVEEASKTANLRDATWKKQWAYIASDEVPQSGKAAAWPDRGIFFSPDAGERSRDAEATPAVETDDGVLWFRPAKVGPGREFKNLIGNVAELVVTDAASIEDVKVDHDAIIAAMGNYEQLRVIGGSSLSDGAMAFDKPWAVDPEDAKQGFADVGVRLAFSAGSSGPAFSEILAQAIGTPVYLRP